MQMRTADSYRAALPQLDHIYHGPGYARKIQMTQAAEQIK
jgi:hypothetical protein